jgi:hypothetical protein
MTRFSAAVALACLVAPVPAQAQAVVAELQQSNGVSSDATSTTSTQLRLYGEPVGNLRFKLEGSFGQRYGTQSDLLGTAYPYGGHADLMEAYAEYLLPERSFVRSVKGGRYRTPFGISSASEQAYIGFTRPPLLRYPDYWAVGNNYMEHGADVVVGWPRFSAELSVGRPADVGTAVRKPGMDTVVRLEGSSDALIVGASFIDTQPFLPLGSGPARFGGLDVRWMRSGVQLRGEYMRGQTMSMTSTDGGYVDLIAHRPGMGPFTALARAEWLDYDVPVWRELGFHAKRFQVAVRMRVWQGLSVATGLMHQQGSIGATILEGFVPRYVAHNRNTATDFSVTYTVRTRP